MATGAGRRRAGCPAPRGTGRARRICGEILRAAVRNDIDILTIYAFSTENWSRPRAEVRMLMRILETVIDRELDELNAEGVQLRHIGQLDGINPALQKKIHKAMELTKDNDRLILNIAFNYGGRDEIVHAVRQIITDGMPAEQIDEALISSYMYTSDLPDPDLIIRTSGELRVSNFLIWQGAYSEYYATPTYWPDFDEAELQRALAAYRQRRRRFGMTDEQIGASPE